MAGVVGCEEGVEGRRLDALPNGRLRFLLEGTGVAIFGARGVAVFLRFVAGAMAVSANDGAASTKAPSTDGTMLGP